MTQLAPINQDVTLRGVYLLWRAANGPLPSELESADGASTSTTPTAAGDLLLKRGYLGPEGLVALCEAYKAGRIAGADVLTPGEAAGLLRA
ncbi:MAG TPA: hypothetical protein VMW52_10605 [Phycisphaerae bacterium]|nr:hypothetical protein [Phycisphaerae bacterium]